MFPQERCHNTNGLFMVDTTVPLHMQTLQACTMQAGADQLRW